jgi:hypothetical protein
VIFTNFMPIKASYRTARQKKPATLNQGSG